MYNYVWLCDIKVYIHCIVHTVNFCFAFLIVITPHNFLSIVFPGIIVEFEHTSYTINENGRGVDVCAQFTGTSSGCSVDFSFEVAIQTADDSAGILSCVTNGGVYSKCFLLFQCMD